MSTAVGSVAGVGRKRRPAPKARRTLKQRFARHLHEVAGDKTNKEIAKRLNVSTGAVASWFTGRKMPDVEMWPALAKMFGLDDYRHILPPD